MANPFDPIRAFVGKDAQGHDTGGLDLKDAFTWDNTKIVDFLKKVSDDPKIYGVPNPDTQKTNLALLYGHINRLQRNGADFVSPKPEQQLLRTTSAINPTGLIPWPGNAYQERTFIIFDMLGIFFSLLGPIPSNGTTKNFLLPLLAVYGKWSSVLSGDGMVQTMTQITWGSKAGANQPRYYFIGGSTAGFARTGPWRPRAQQLRWGYVNAVPLQNRNLYPNFNDSPKRAPDKDGTRGTRFGNCGETYPFLYLLRDTQLRDNTYGMAIYVASIAPKATYSGTDYWKKGTIIPPCDNCKHLIARLGGKEANFRFDPNRA